MVGMTPMGSLSPVKVSSILSERQTLRRGFHRLGHALQPDTLEQLAQIPFNVLPLERSIEVA